MESWRTLRFSSGPKRLTLAELEALASALLAVLFALFLTRVTAHKAFSLHLGAQLRVELLKSAGDAHADSATLCGDSTATASDDDVKAGGSLGKHKRGLSNDALGIGHEVNVIGLAVDGHIARTR